MENETYFVIDYKLDQPTFREIHLLKAYTLSNLVGNVGGYIGMFLGYAFLHLPATFSIAFENMRKWIHQMKLKHSNTQQDETGQSKTDFTSIE